MPTYSSALLPSTSGLTFGSSALRWSGYFTDINLSGSLTVNSAAGGGVINILSYGAISGQDSTTAIQAAINACDATHGTVYVPPGTYYVSTVLTGTQYLANFIGDGTHLSKLSVLSSASTNAIFTTTTCPDGFKLRGLQFVGPGASASGTQVGVTLNNNLGNVSDCIFEDLYFQGWSNYCFQVDAPIVCTFRNIRYLQSKRGVYYNGGTSCTTSACYANQITLAGFDVRGTDYSTWSSCAADTCGISYLLRNLSQGCAFVGCGHEIGTARNVTVTNVALTSNVATISYTGDDLSVDWVSGLTIPISGTTSTAGLFNVRAVPTAVTSSTIVFPLTHADVPSASDSGSASLFPGDGIVINNSSGTQVSGFYGLSAQQLTSDHIVVSGTSNNTWLSGVISEVGSSGTPVTQTIDVYMGAAASNVMRFNNNLIGGTTNLSTNSQTYSNGSWTVGSAISQNGTPASAGFLRLTKAGVLNFRNNANGADITGLALDASDVVQVGSSGMKTVGATPTVSASQLGLGTTTGFGTGAAGTAVTTTTKGGGTGPTTPQTVVNHLKVNIGGTDYYVPLVQ